MEKQFGKLQRAEQKEIRDALEFLKDDPLKPEKLVGDLTGHWSLHVGRSLRVIYKIEGNTIVVRAVGYHYIYQEFSMYLRKVRK